MYPKSKSQLIEYLSGMQVLCLALALVVFGGWIHGRIGQLIRQQVMEENQLIAQQVGRLLRTIHDGEFAFGDSAWEKFQSIVEDTKLPNDGYLCIAEVTTGDLLCHPKIRKHPSLRSVCLQDFEVTSNNKQSWNLFQAVVKSRDESDVALTGIAGKGSSTEVVSAAFLPNINGVLFVHQAEASTKAAVLRIVTPLGYAGVIIGSVLIFVTSKWSTKIVKGYEHELAALNAGLEQTVRNRTASLMKTRNAVIFGLAKLAESRDRDTGEHLERISQFSSLLAAVHAKVSPEVDRECRR